MTSIQNVIRRQAASRTQQAEQLGSYYRNDIHTVDVKKHYNVVLIQYWISILKIFKLRFERLAVISNSMVYLTGSGDIGLQP